MQKLLLIRLGRFAFLVLQSQRPVANDAPKIGLGCELYSLSP
jgi:hypothetical protein